MRKIIFKEEGKLWPTVIWKGSELVVYYLNDQEDVIDIEKTRGLDFDELLLRIDKGYSIFITTGHQGWQANVKQGE